MTISSRRSFTYMPLLDDASLEDPNVHTVTVTPEQRQTVLQQIGNAAGGTVARVGSALSAAGDYTRGVLAGKAGERVTGRELLREYGLVGPEDNWGNFAAGVVADTLTDPLSYLAPGITQAGKAVKMAGLADDVATIATKKALATKAPLSSLPSSAQTTAKALQATGRNLSEFDPAVIGRPLFGPSSAKRYLTLEDVATHGGPDALKRIQDTIGVAEYNRLKGETLGKSFGFGLPLGETIAAGDVLGKGVGDALANASDTVGQAVRWSAPGRVAAAMFDKRVNGAVDAERQITNAAKFANRTSSVADATRGHVFDLAKLEAAAPEIKTADGGRRLGRVLEIPESHWSPQDASWVNSNKAIRDFVDAHPKTMETIRQESRNLGMKSQKMVDRFGIQYVPRQADPILGMKSVDDTMGRTFTMSLPGGRETIIDLSLDKNVTGPNRVLQKPEDAAAYLKAKLTPMLATGNYSGKPITSLTDRQMLNLSRVLASLPDAATQGNPLFGQHPLQMIGAYREGRAAQMATNKTLYDSLATFAVNTPRNQIAGPEHVALPQALKQLGLQPYDKGATGAYAQMRSRLEQLFGAGNVPANLADVSIPKEHLDRLLRAKDTFQFDEPSSAFLKGLDHYTQLWKGSILAWPARAVRDLYSGAASNWLEGAFDTHSMTAVKQLLAHGPTDHAFLTDLAQIPRYSGNDGVANYFADLASTKLLNGPSAFESGAAMRGRYAFEPIIGSEPTTIGSIGKELAPKAGRSWGQFRKDFLNWRSAANPLAENTNPLLRAGEKMNTLTDTINRLSGYNALLKKGYSPEAAAAAMKRVHVDYDSLSDFEKTFLKSMFPWYTYQSKIFREVVRQLAERPGGRYGAMLKTSERAQEGADDEYIPSSLRSSFAAPLPDILGGRPAPGTRRYLADIDLPGVDQINMVETPGTLSGTLHGTARQIGMQLHPLARTAAELAFGQDLFSNRPIGEATSPLDAIVRSVTGNRDANVPTLVEKGVELIPIVGGRPLYTLRSLLDDTGDSSLASRAVKTAANALTGVKLRDVTPEQRLSDAARELEASVDPYTREFKQVYIPENMIPYVPGWAQQRMAVVRQLNRENKAIRKAHQGQVHNSSLFD